jgi:hypothetical protein
MSTLIKDQPNPIAGKGDVLLSVIESVKLLAQTNPDCKEECETLVALLEERRLLGISRYGTPLQLFNGRDAFLDTMQELLDASAYIQQCVTELCYKREATIEHKAMEELRTSILECCKSAAFIFKTFRAKA